jgi:hypothetical protein
MFLYVFEFWVCLLYSYYTDADTLPLSQFLSLSHSLSLSHTHTLTHTHIYISLHKCAMNNGLSYLCIIFKHCLRFWKKEWVSHMVNVFNRICSRCLSAQHFHPSPIFGSMLVTYYCGADKSDRLRGNWIITINTRSY